MAGCLLGRFFGPAQCHEDQAIMSRVAFWALLKHLTLSGCFWLAVLYLFGGAGHCTCYQKVKGHMALRSLTNIDSTSWNFSPSHCGTCVLGRLPAQNRNKSLQQSLPLRKRRRRRHMNQRRRGTRDFSPFAVGGLNGKEKIAEVRP